MSRHKLKIRVLLDGSTVARCTGCEWEINEDRGGPLQIAAMWNAAHPKDRQ